MPAKARAAFIDRDGVINQERNYVHRIADFVLLPGVVQGLSLLRNAGYRLIVVTNQAGIVEVQGTAEGEPFDEEALLRLLRLARIGCNEVFAAQLKAVGR